jgi:colanic acid biosynthesis glycosyl transferase WcaI
MLKVAIVGINYRPDLTGISVYTTGLAEYLAGEGDCVDVYTGFSYYPGWRKNPKDQWRWFAREEIADVGVRRHYLYVPAQPSALKRMLHELSFVASVSLGYLFGQRADVTVIVSPSLFLGIPIALLAKLKGSATLFHVQDLQPDAAVDLGMLKPGLVTNIFYWLERMTYRLCDRISTISDGMRKRIIGKSVPAEKLSILRNWANDDQVCRLSRTTQFRCDWNLGSRFVVLYSGNMGVKQGLDSLLDCAEVMRDREDVVFVIVGDGGEKPKLMASAAARDLRNVQFQPLQPMEQLGELLATADVAVIPQKPGVADIVLPSKLGNIMASGRPVVVAAADGTELCSIVTESNCGRVVAQGDGRAMAEGVSAILADSLLASHLGENGVRYMEKNFGKSAILDSFRAELHSLVSRRSGTPVELLSR